MRLPGKHKPLLAEEPLATEQLVRGEVEKSVSE
jgi:hypothetical protein